MLLANECTEPRHSDAVEFTNKYNATGEITLGGTKKIDKRNFKEGDTATFKIEAVTANAPVPTPATVTIEPTSGDSQDFTETVDEGQVLGALTGLVRRGRRLNLASWAYRCYVMLWCRPFGLRRMLLRVLHRMGIWVPGK